MEGVKHYRSAAAAFLLMMAMALTTTGLSFFVGPVCDGLGFGRGAFTVYYSAMTAAPLFGVVFDLTGSYAGAMGAAAMLLVPALVGSVAVFRRQT